LSHLVRRQDREDGHPVEIPVEQLREWQLDNPLPSPADQADTLILWLGDNQPSVAESAPVAVPSLSAWLGVKVTPTSPDAGFGWLIAQDSFQRLAENRGDQNGRLLLRLKMEGWQRYQDLKEARIQSKAAFMAMQFGDDELTRVVRDCFKPAVAQAGFELRVLTDRQPAGSIDDQLRVALRNSRFIVADLTHGNHGAYWESGFGEGLGRPVIYTCREAEWKERKTHFDTNHLVTIIWKPTELADAGRRLTNTIRATLPAEARLTDN
jgi:hypothetical protein